MRTWPAHDLLFLSMSDHASHLKGAGMRLLIATVLMTLLLVSDAFARGAPIGAQHREFGSADKVLNWISAYREDRKPEKLPDFVKATAKLGLLRDDERSGIYFGFVAGVLADNQTKAARLIEAMFPLRPEDQLIVIRGLAYSGLPDWKRLLEQVAERMPARKVQISNYLFGKGKTLEQRTLDEGPEVLDAWWGYYFATGSYYPLQRIITALKWAGEDNDLERLTVGSMAKWTLATNGSRDKHLLDYLRFEQAHQPKVITVQLRQVVLAAENFEVAKLRRKTLASLERLKKNGPAKWSKWSWWGRAGQLALTAGCVAASALGQVELGLPCIIGGAASSGLLRLLDLQKTRPQ